MQSSSLLSSTDTKYQQEPNDRGTQLINTADDGVFNYACRPLSYGLLSRNFQDATDNGNGKCTCSLEVPNATFQDERENQICTRSI